MISKATMAVAGLALAFSGALAAGSLARAEVRAQARYCSNGFEADARGHCPPEGPVTYGPCQPGFHYQSFPNGNGFRCMQDGY